MAPVPRPPGAERGHCDACAPAAGRPLGALQEGSHGATCREGTGPWGGPGTRPQNHRVCPCISWSAPSHSATEQTTMPSRHLRGWQDPTGGPRRLTASLPGRKVLGVTEQVAANGTVTPTVREWPAGEMLAFVPHGAEGEGGPSGGPRSSRRPARGPRHTEAAAAAGWACGADPGRSPVLPWDRPCPPALQPAVFCRPPGAADRWPARGPRRAPASAPRGAGVFPRRCSRLRVLLQRGGANVGCSVRASPRVTVFCYFKRKDYVSGTNSDERRMGKLQCENKWGSGADRGSDTLLGPRQAGARDSWEQSWPRPGAAGVGKSGGGEPAARPPGRAGKSGRQRPRGRRAGPASGQDATPSAVGEGSRRK